MKHMFNEDYSRRLHEEWNNFLSGKPVNTDIVRPEILECWETCRDNGIDYTEYKILNENSMTYNEFQALLKKNAFMCEIAEPLIKNLLLNIPGPASNVYLLSKEPQALLKLSSEDNPEYDKYLKRHGLMPGMYSFPETLLPAFPEICLCKQTLAPQYSYGEENYFSFSKDWYCAAAPILDEDGNLMGILSISDTKDYYDRQSLALVTSAAKAIENEMKIKKAYVHLANTVEQLYTTVELVPDGVILVDQEGTVNVINETAKDMLFIDGTISEKNILDVLNDDSGIFSSLPVSVMPETDVMLKTKNGFRRYYISIKKYTPSSCPELGELSLITIKDSKAAQKCINNVTSSHSKFDFGNIVGRSKKLTDAINLGVIASKSSSNVLVTGASGTGKELFAHAIHSASDRSKGPFISINCGALPANLVESELFGYEGGAFTGSKKTGQIGKFELANNGTLFLDEIGEMPLAVQASILRAIETKEITRIGGSKPVNVDVRIIAATNRNLIKAKEEKAFREDLYYRLNVLRIHVPELCKRKSDIRLLTDKFLSDYTTTLNKHHITLTDDAYKLLEEYDWPGNVRELENTIERIVNICDDDVIVDSSLIHNFIKVDEPDSESDRPAPSPAKNTTQIKAVERQLIIDTLINTNGSITETAKAIGIGRRTLYRKCEEYDIDYNSFRE